MRSHYAFVMAYLRVMPYSTDLMTCPSLRRVVLWVWLHDKSVNLFPIIYLWVTAAPLRPGDHGGLLFGYVAVSVAYPKQYLAFQ